MLFKVAIHDGNLPETSFSEKGQLIDYICLTMPSFFCKNIKPMVSCQYQKTINNQIFLTKIVLQRSYVK